MKIGRKTILTFGSAAILLAPFAASANTATSVINATITASISTFTTTSPVTITLAPGGSPDQSCASDTVTVSTNAANGYSLTLQDNNAGHTTNVSNVLANGGNNIPNSVNTFASPAVLATNTWGWREDSAGSFGAGPTAAGNTAGTCGSLTFALVPGNGLAQTVSARATGPYSNDVHTLWFSAKADSTKPNGTYTGTVLLTATAL